MGPASEVDVLAFPEEPEEARGCAEESCTGPPSTPHPSAVATMIILNQDAARLMGDSPRGVSKRNVERWARRIVMKWLCPGWGARPS